MLPRNVMNTGSYTFTFYQKKESIMTTQTLTLNIDGMTCGGCVKSVTNAVNQVAGVQNCEVSLEQSQAVIQFDDGVTSETALKEAIEDAGYDIK